MRRHLDAAPESYAAVLIDRLADGIYVVDAVLGPTAAELVKEGVTVEQALTLMERRVIHLRSLLGERA